MNSGSDSLSDGPIDVWVTSNGTPMLRPASWRGWKTRRWIARLSGTTSRPLMAGRGAASWISSLRAFRVSQAAQPGDEKGPTMTAGSGRRSFGLSAQLTLDLSSSRTSPDSSPSTMELHSERLWRRWPHSASMQSGTVSRRRRWGHPISASGCSYWPTPRTITGGGESGDRKQELGRMESGGGDLQAAVQMWPTPTASDAWVSESAESISPEARERQLRRGDSNGSRRASTGMLAKEVLWADDLSHRAQRHETSGSQSSPNGRRLNPLFVEWLMGWPIGWTDFEPLETEWCRWLRQSRSWLSLIVRA